MADTLTVKRRRQLMALVRDHDTAPERVVRRVAHALGYRYRLHVRELPGCPDLVFPRLQKVIFVHGCFWHQHSCSRGDRIPKSRADYWRPKLVGNKARDRRHAVALRKIGWRVLVVWECETTPNRRAALQLRLKRFLAE